MNDLALLAPIVWKIDLKKLQGFLAKIDALEHKKNRQYEIPFLFFTQKFTCLYDAHTDCNFFHIYEDHVEMKMFLL